MSSPRHLLACLAAAAAAVAGGCGGTAEIEVPKSQSALHRGAELFSERCSGCHTLEAARSQGSKPEGQVSGGERTNGPNFNVRRENRDDVLFAIRNGGFSGAIMPANIVVGRDAEDVALFVERYAGRKAPVQGQAQGKTSQGGK
ncbi:MAG TPA: cytochrome c [Thermoleophilaceae bacterium]|jgi:mono/diheme cytochrome c family protein